MSAPTKTSLIDAVNERDEAVAAIERGEALSRGANFRTAHIFVLNDSGELLLQRLGSERDRHPRRWGSSVAAYLHSGETYEEGARRRLCEELGLDLPLKTVGKIRMRDTHSLKFVTLFLAHDGMPEIREPWHIDELGYWTIARINRALDTDPANFTPTFRELYKAFSNRIS